MLTKRLQTKNLPRQEILSAVISGRTKASGHLSRPAYRVGRTAERVLGKRRFIRPENDGFLTFPAGFCHENGNHLFSFFAFTLRASHLGLLVLAETLYQGKLMFTRLALILISRHISPHDN
jgi:hypothetical protein